MKNEGRGSNLSHEDRVRGGENSHSGSGSSNLESGRGSNLSHEDRVRGGENSHSGGRNSSNNSE
jgi:hypothetical protein